MTRNIWLSVLAIGISLLTHYALGPWIAKWMADSLVLGVAAGMSWTWTPAARRALRAPSEPDGSDKIVLTIWLAWTLYFVQRVYTIANAALERPEWLTNSVIPLLIATLIFLAGLYGLAAPASTAKDMPRRQMLTVWSGWFVTGLVTGAAAVYLLIMGF